MPCRRPPLGPIVLYAVLWALYAFVSLGVLPASNARLVGGASPLVTVSTRCVCSAASSSQIPVFANPLEGPFELHGSPLAVPVASACFHDPVFCRGGLGVGGFLHILRRQFASSLRPPRQRSRTAPRLRGMFFWWRVSARVSAVYQPPSM